MQNRAKATVTFFKDYGKYYTEELYQFDNIQDEPYVVFDAIKECFKHSYRGMHMIVTFDEAYEKGYPFMEPAEERQ